jgi:hypothetical protein
VLVFFDTSASLKNFKDSAEMVALKGFVKVMTEETTQTEKTGLIKSAATKGNVVLLTREFGRGTDFVCYDQELDRNGGVHVIQTFVSDLKSEETQIKGRTARQGKRGSYMMILDENDLEKYGIKEREVQIMRDTGKLYSTLSQHRDAFFNKRFPDSIKGVEGIVAEHKQGMSFLQDLSTALTDVSAVSSVSVARKKVREFLLEHNRGMNPSSSNCRTICLMDATGSMSGLLQKSKNTVGEMFERAKKVLDAQRASDSTFEIQFVCFRNYDCRLDRILLASQWESNASNLRSFMHAIEAEGGTHWEEAVELGLFHANQEAESSSISQVILIGDAAPNTTSQVRKGRDRFGESYWGNTRFNQPTHIDIEVQGLAAKEVPVHCFYVHPAARESFESIANATKGKSGYLDIDSSAGAEMLTDIVTENVLNNIGGSEFVEQYRKMFKKGYV